MFIGIAVRVIDVFIRVNVSAFINGFILLSAFIFILFVDDFLVLCISALTSAPVSTRGLSA